MNTLPDAVILFGASGFIGRNIVDALAGRIERLVAVTGRTPEVDGASQTITLDRIDELPVLPERTVIIHVAARRYDASTFRTDQNAILDDNVSMTNRVFAFAARRGVKEVRQASSSAVYPSSFEILDDERPFSWNEWPHEGEAAYAWSKRWGEIVAEHHRRNHGVHTLSFRLSNPYGPYDTTDIAAAHVATAFALRALEPGPDFVIRGNPDAERDFVYAGDVARVFEASLSIAGEHEAMNLGQGRTISVRQLAEAAVAASGGLKRIVVEGPPGGGVAVRRMTSARLARRFPEIGFQTPREGFERTIAWYGRALHDAQVRAHG